MNERLLQIIQYKTSINPAPQYAPFEVALRDIFGIYRILLCLSVK